MSHQLFGNRYLSHRVPAWHGIGAITEQELSAREALAHIGGDLNVRLHPNYTMIEGVLVDLPGRSIVRAPTPDDHEHVVLGQVGSEYTLITPGDMADIWDASVGKPIETMGLLRRGALFFCTTRLPAIDIKGDEVEQYLGVCSPMDGLRSASAEVWPLRVCCANTLKAAQSQAQTCFRVVHDGSAKERLGLWLRQAYDEAEANYRVIKQTFELLAEHRVPLQAAHAVIRRSYPEPRPPRRNAPDEVMEARLERFERAKDRIRARREMALALFQGDGTGMDSVAAKGTLWGLYNSVTELENYRKGFAQGGLEAEAARVGEDLLFGSRGVTMERALNACLAAAGAGSEGDPSLN